MINNLPIIIGFSILIISLFYGAHLLIQAERRRKVAIAQRKTKRAHDEAVRKEYQDLMIELDNGRETTTHLIKNTNVTFSYRFSTNDDTREIPTIEAENADSELSDVWVTAIEGLEIE